MVSEDGPRDFYSTARLPLGFVDDRELAALEPLLNSHRREPSIPRNPMGVVTSSDTTRIHNRSKARSPPWVPRRPIIPACRRKSKKPSMEGCLTHQRPCTSSAQGRLGCLPSAICCQQDLSFVWGQKRSTFRRALSERNFHSRRVINYTVLSPSDVHSIFQ